MRQASAGGTTGEAVSTTDAVALATPEPPEHRGPSHRRTWAIVVVLAVLSGILAVTVAKRVYPDGTRNRDDQAYVAQARLLEEGNVTLPVSQARFFRPNMTGIRGDKLVYVYTPVWAAVLASSLAVTGSALPALAITAAVTVLAFALLADELWRDRRVLIASTVIFALSPFVVSQSGTYLSYELSLLLYLLFGALLLRGVRTRTPAMLVGAGIAIGIAFLARPFDALLWAAPFAVYVVLRRRDDLRSLASPAGWLLLGVVPLLALTAALNWHLMGSPMSFPQNVAGSLNKFGFGRRLGIHDARTNAATPIDFTFGRSWSAMVKDIQLLPRWILGSYVTIALALFGVIRLRREARAWLLVALVVVFPIGYLFWWGNYSATFGFHLVLGLGPYYYFPAVAPIALLAGYGIVTLAAWLATERVSTAVTGVAIVAVAGVASTVVLLRYAYHDATRLRHQERVALAQVAPARDARALLFLDQDQLGNPYPELVNRPDLRNRPLYALDHPSRDMELMAAVPGRPVYALRHVFDLGADIFVRHPRPTLTRIETRDVPLIRETLTFRNPGRKRFVIAYATQGSHTETRVLDTRSSPRRTYTVTWTVAAPSVSLPGGPDELSLAPTRASLFALGFATSESPSLRGADRYELRWSYAAGATGPARVAEPPSPFVDLVFLNGRSVWEQERVDPTLVRG